MKFEGFQKIARLKRECLITEKLDGTNAQVYIVRSLAPEEGAIAHKSLGAEGDLSMFAGSRTRWITPTDDNMGFAKWAQAHADELWSLGEGQHFGEWWGQGIQRRYDQAEKRFSLFNAWRWNDQNPNRPACCGVVPNLYTGPFSTDATEEALSNLRVYGSVAAPGFMKPEGIITYLSAARTYFKQTIDKDEEYKGKQEGV